jgi:hypothetical protein
MHASGHRLLTAVLLCAGAAYGCSEILGVDFGSKTSPEEAGGTGGSGASPDAPGGCTSDDECRQANPGLNYTCQAGVCKGECENTEFCKNKYGGTHACIDAFCVDLKSSDCQTIGEGWDSESPIFIGVLEDTTSPLVFTDRFHFFLEAVRLAHKQFDQKAIQPGGRRMVLVECDETKDAEAAAKHLVDDVKAKILLGPATADAQIKVFRNVVAELQSQPANSVVLFTRSAFPDFLNLSENAGYGWSCSPAYEDRARAVAALVASLESKLRVDAGLQDNEDLRVAVLSNDDVGYQTVSDVIAQTTSVNGRTLLQQVGGAYRKFSAPNPSACTDPLDNPCLDVAKEIRDYRPHLVLTNAPAPTFNNVFRKLELTYWAEDVGDGGVVPPRPFYIAAQWDFSIDSLNSSAAFYNFGSRVRALDYVPADPEQYDRFFADYADAVQVPFASIQSDIGFMHDCVFLYAYALVAALREQKPGFSGADVNYGLRFLQPPFGGSAEKIQTGRGETLDQIEKAFAALKDGKNIDLQGLFGPLRLDETRHTPNFNLTVVCPYLLTGKKSVVDSKQYFDAGQGQLVGTYECPSAS